MDTILEDSVELTSAVEDHAPTMGNLAKVRYTHLDMIDYMICNPAMKMGDLALRYGYTAGWISNVQASDAWKAAFAKRRSEVTDDMVAQSVKDRMEGITLLSLERLQDKLEQPTVSDQVVLKAVELGAKGMGLGGNAPPVNVVPAGDHLAQLAERLVNLQTNIRTKIIEGEVVEETSTESI